MRISGWSSGVCSSDLGRKPTPPLSGPPLEGEREERQSRSITPSSCSVSAMLSRAASLIFSWSSAKRNVASNRPRWVPQTKHAPRKREAQNGEGASRRAEGGELREEWEGEER